MPSGISAPIGSPSWADLWTADVGGSRRFYRELFGWEAQEPSEEFGGYFMFTRDGVPVAGGMGGTPDLPAENIWSVYLNTGREGARSHTLWPTGHRCRPGGRTVQAAYSPSPEASPRPEAAARPFVAQPKRTLVRLWQPRSPSSGGQRPRIG